ncbi:hypothetical protein OIO90_000585 [Microbotryomycetes sp. JL221]|nr:hypothetical protein OIO90_000585 [Microbotryomycetes sp. JL221]
MGASGSKVDVEQSGDETTFFAEKTTPVQTLDQHIQSRIQSELKRLREQEAQVRQEIERALEKENLDREKGSNESSAGLAHSASLLKDLEELEGRTLSLKEESRKHLESAPWRTVESERKSLVECFKNNKSTPLNCQLEVNRFKDAVAGVEKAFVANLQ